MQGTLSGPTKPTSSDRRSKILVSNQIELERGNFYSLYLCFCFDRLGGQDPLDYISLYANPGDSEQNIPPHWHYISFGLSDLYGDERVYGRTGDDMRSGFGFELTFRLKREQHDTSPPTWPATVMQSLAKYVFQTEDPLFPGDHVSWHCSLDRSGSRIHHMLMTEDPNLGTVNGPFGQVTFVQIVGVMQEELQAAQQWNVNGKRRFFI